MKSVFKYLNLCFPLNTILRSYILLVSLIIYLHNYTFWKAFRFRCPGQQLVLRALYAGDQRHVTSPDQRDLHKKLTAFVRWRNLSFLGQIKRRNCNCDVLIGKRTHEIQVPESHQKWIYLQIKTCDLIKNNF